MPDYSLGVTRYYQSATQENIACLQFYDKLIITQLKGTGKLFIFLITLIQINIHF